MAPAGAREPCSVAAMAAAVTVGEGRVGFSMQWAHISGTSSGELRWSESAEMTVAVSVGYEQRR